MALLAVQLEDAHALWTNDPRASGVFQVHIEGEKVLAMNSADFECLLHAMTRLYEMYLTRSMTIRSE